MCAREIRHSAQQAGGRANQHAEAGFPVLRWPRLGGPPPDPVSRDLGRENAFCQEVVITGLIPVHQSAQATGLRPRDVVLHQPCVVVGSPHCPKRPRGHVYRSHVGLCIVHYQAIPVRGQQHGGVDPHHRRTVSAGVPSAIWAHRAIPGWRPTISAS